MNVQRYVIAGGASLVIHAALLFVSQENKVFAMPAGNPASSVSLNLVSAPPPTLEKPTPENVEPPKEPQPQKQPEPEKKIVKKQVVKKEAVKKKVVEKKPEPIKQPKKVEPTKTVAKQETQPKAEPKKKVEPVKKDTVTQQTASASQSKGATSQPILVDKPTFVSQPTQPRYQGLRKDAVSKAQPCMKYGSMKMATKSNMFCLNHLAPSRWMPQHCVPLNNGNLHHIF